MTGKEWYIVAVVALLCGATAAHGLTVRELAKLCGVAYGTALAAENSRHPLQRVTEVKIRRIIDDGEQIGG